MADSIHLSARSPAPPLTPAFPDCAGPCVLRKETDHRVANHLMMLSGYVRLQDRQFSRAAVVDREAVSLFARSIDAQIRAIARLHRHLMANASGRSTDLATLLDEVVDCFAIGQKTCTVIRDFDPACSVRTDQLLPITQIVNEAVTNALKYAFGGNQPGVLTVRCETLPSGDLRVEVGDTGTGRFKPASRPVVGGFGIGLMQGLARQLGGTLDLDSGPDGLIVRLTVPSTAAPTL